MVGPLTANKLTKIINCRYLANHTIVSDSYLWFEDGKFVSPQHVFFDLYRKPDEVIDAGGLLVVPGFIDVQINGAFGFDFTQDIGRLESDEEVHRALDRVSKGLLKYGCTAYCPTVISSDQEVYHRVLPFLRPRKGTHERAEILGAHIEGPFISHGKKGAHNDKVILDASVGMSVVDERYGDEVALKRGGSLPRAFGEVERAASIVTVAPEVEGIMDVIPELVKRGVVVSIGHSEAFLKDAEAAIVKGATFITHLFNAMQTFHHRDPGIIGILGSTTLPHSPHANLPSPSRTSVDKTQSDPRPFYGIICDGIHTHPNSIKIAYYGHPTGCVLITDAINALGLPAGGYNLGTGDVWVDEHARAYLKGTNTLAGSATPIDACVRKFAAFTKCTLVEAIEAATLHPAQLLGIQDRKGTLAIGADADFLIVDDSKGPENLRVERVFVGGQEARIDNIAFRGSLSMDPLVVQLEKASIEHENEETSAKEGDGETSRVSAITSKPRTSRPTRTIPRGVSRRTGPKGVLSDHADYLHSLAQDKHAKIAAPNEGVLARAPTVNTYGQELEQEQRERDAKKQALDKDDEHAEDSDDLFEEDDEAVRKYNNVRMQQLRQRRDTRLSYGSIESVSADDYADIIDTTPNGTVVLVHLYDPSLSASKALQHYLNNLSQKYIYARFLQVSAPSLNFDLVGSPAMLIYKDTRLIINLVGLSETLKERNGTTKMDLEDVEDLLLSISSGTAALLRTSTKSRVYPYNWRLDDWLLQVMTPPEARTLECTQTYITRQEIDARTKTGEILIIYSDKVYKLDKWIKYHPGGVLAIQHLNGKDATDEIHMMHPEDVYRRQVHRYYVGEYADDTDLSITQRYPPSALPTPPRTPVLDHSTRLEYLTSNCIRGTERKESLDAKKLRLSYEEFARRIEELGLDKCNYWNYGIELCRYTALFVSSLLFIFYGYQTWHYMFSAVLMAGFWHQVSFFAHDAGHNSITHVLKVDNAVGIIAANWLGGLSLGWWKKSHNVHHIITNDPEHDPDIQHLPFFAVSERFANNLYSTYYKRILPFDAAARRFVSVQHWTYYLILSFGRFNLYRLSFEFLANEENYRYFYFEVTGLVFFWCWLGYVLSHLPSWGMIWAWIMVSHILTVSLHVQITLSHFGMSTEVIEDEPFPAKMLRTTMDVDCPTWLDWYHGGLQFQAIHHLFPRVPRHNLRACVPLVRQFAKDNGLTYHSYDFAKGNGIVLGRLKEVADQIKLLGEVAKWKAEMQMDEKTT